MWNISLNISVSFSLTVICLIATFYVLLTAGLVGVMLIGEQLTPMLNVNLVKRNKFSHDGT